MQNTATFRPGVHSLVAALRITSMQLGLLFPKSRFCFLLLLYNGRQAFIFQPLPSAELFPLSLELSSTYKISFENLFLSLDYFIFLFSSVL